MLPNKKSFSKKLSSLSDQIPSILVGAMQRSRREAIENRDAHRGNLSKKLGIEALEKRQLVIVTRCPLVF